MLHLINASDESDLLLPSAFGIVTIDIAYD